MWRAACWLSTVRLRQHSRRLRISLPTRVATGSGSGAASVRAGLRRSLQPKACRPGLALFPRGFRWGVRWPMKLKARLDVRFPFWDALDGGTQREIALRSRVASFEDGSFVQGRTAAAPAFCSF